MSTIMLVDDSATILLSISSILSKAGYTVEKAANAEAHDDRGSEGADFREPAVRIAWRGVDFTTLDEPLARTFFDVARALLPVPDPGASKP